MVINLVKYNELIYFLLFNSLTFLRRKVAESNQDLAILYAKNNKTDKALSSILKAISLDPENKKNKD